MVASPGTQPGGDPQIACGNDVIALSRARLAELAPAIEEASKFKAALEVLNGGVRPPVTVLDTLKPVPPPET